MDYSKLKFTNNFVFCKVLEIKREMYYLAKSCKNKLQKFQESIQGNRRKHV